MAGWFELSKISDGQFQSALKADEKETLLASETYHSRGSAENGITSVRGNCAVDGRYERNVASDGTFFRTGAHQRKELERLCRYITHPTIANGRFLARAMAGVGRNRQFMNVCYSQAFAEEQRCWSTRACATGKEGERKRIFWQ